MELTKQHKLLIGVVGAAVLVVGADRVFLSGASGPEEAEAATPAEPSSAANSLASIESLRAWTVDGETLADRVLALAAPDDFVFDAVADPFTPDASWYPEETESPGPTPNALSEENAPPPSFQLEAVMARSGGGQAMINGRILRVGESIDGYMLTVVRAGSVTLESDNGEITLRLDDRLRLEEGDRVEVGPKKPPTP
ncbi:MAG: hypothetical protein ACF8PN_16470 [Phycisphaerales bacterium]